MRKEKNLEKEFSRYLDRLIDRKEVEINPHTEVGIRTALDFAKKMMELRPNPSADFLVQSKARLIKKLINQEALRKTRNNVKRNWFENLIAQPIWQAAGIIIILTVLGLVVWNYGIFQSGKSVVTTTATSTTTTSSQTIATSTATTAITSTTTTVSTTSSPTSTTTTKTYTTTATQTATSSIVPTTSQTSASTTKTYTATTTATATTTKTVTTTTTSSTKTTTTPATTSMTVTSAGSLVRAEGNVDKSSYIPGENIKISITFINISLKPLQIELPPALTIWQTQPLKPVFNFTLTREIVSLSPDETINYSIEWDQRDNNGIFVTSGTYQLEGYITYQGKQLQIIFTNQVIIDISN
jgi:hypothetical protein